ncbi:MAG TPA: hypothetical protein VGQ04_16120, partial [Chitinophagaceae bacterium]|nr:hypothetical protein [Chitinophagaceae bacterium]
MLKQLTISFLFVSMLLHVQAQQFKITYTEQAFKGPFTGKVFLYLSKDNPEPRSGGVGIEFFPCMSIDVTNIKPGAAIIVDDKASSFPVKLSEIERGEYYVQAVWDRNMGGRAIAESPGNMFSRSEKVLLTKDFSKIYTLVSNEVVPEQIFKQTQFVKELKAASTLLGSFHHKTMTVDAAVILPEEYYEEPQRSFPVMFIVSGYGGNYHFYSGDS